MKKMLDELRSLNNIEDNYTIPENFSRNIINKIKSTKKSSNIIKYVASTVTLVAACFIVVTLVTNSEKLNHVKEDSSTNESQILDKEELKDFDATYNDNFQSNNSVVEDMYVPTESLKEEVASGTNTNDAVLKENYRKEYYNTIIDLLKTNNIEAEETKEGIKAKCTKEEAEDILFYYNEITITAEENFVIIK